MVWDVEVTDQFTQWWSMLSDDQREAVTDRVDILAERGPISVGRSWTVFIRRDINR